VGRLFDAPEVDEAPRILTRIEPRLPSDLQGRPSADVVIVRVLVSQAGHPFRVMLLRRSRLGPSADEAVIAAVKRWTFSAARRKGEPVSCWYNLAVPLSVQ
jgi:TonB family protein